MNNNHELHTAIEQWFRREFEFHNLNAATLQQAENEVVTIARQVFANVVANK